GASKGEDGSGGQPASEAVPGGAAAVADGVSAAGSGGSIRPTRATTLLPGKAIWVPAIITRSVGSSPPRTTRNPPSITGPRVTSRAATVPSRPTTSSSLRVWSVCTAVSG